MIRYFLIVLAVFILLSLAGYAISLILKLRKQSALEHKLRQEAEKAQKERFQRIVDSIDIIARAMLAEQCDLSEGVLRLKTLMDVIALKLEEYPAMWALYEVIEDMPILDERKTLKRNERMKLDLEREAKEAELESQIKQECQQLLINIEQFKQTL